MIICGDCLVEMAKMEPNSIDAIVTDPPYGLEFMGKEWDHGIPGVHFWVEALRVAKPGCHLLAFGGTRTFHRLACAIEDAGWEIRDCLGWLYGSGFPKSESASLAIDRKACREELEGRLGRKSTKDELKAAWSEYRQVVGDFPNDRPNSHGKNAIPVGSAGLGQGTKMTAPATDSAREWEGWGTALKPAWEPIILARKPLDGTVAANVIKWGTGAINVDGCRVPCDDKTKFPVGDYGDRGLYGAPGNRTDDPNRQGRWPANLIHDGSDEVMELFPQTSTGDIKRGTYQHGKIRNVAYGEYGPRPEAEHAGDSGSAARFFYCAKASRKEREMGCEGMPDRTKRILNGGIPSAVNSDPRGMSGGGDRVAKNHHPTVKPLTLMRYLCRLVTPPNGLILDPFMGSGTTLIAAEQEGFNFMGIDISQEYCDIAGKRLTAGETQ